MTSSRTARMSSIARVAGAAAGAVAALAIAWPAQAQLFKDDEARKAVLDLRARVTQSEEAAKARETELTTALTRMNAQLVEQIGAMRRSLLEMNNQLETMRGELATMRGNNETLQRDVAELQRRSRDIGQTLDDRLRRLEPVKVTIDGREFAVDPEERKTFEDAMAVMRGGDFERAAGSLANFQRRYAGSPYTNQARFWLGNALYGKRDYKGAIDAFRNFVAGAPDHPRAPEALLALANSQAETKDNRGARATLQELIKTYPASEAAQAGKDRLASLPAR
ncbi:MAG: tol-pal system protein YbgF [Betaproteobacteria bacterium]|nr:tol-pal system protein YbgF [Betaproteobacteria bacterium]MCC6248055.1 tol-pal system protein YbgF [Rubrivivax sp.]